MILLDTHVLVWLAEASPRLGRQARKAIDTAYRQSEVVVSAISFWEVATLARKGRIHLDMEIQAWRNDFIEQGVIEFPVTGDIGIKAAGLDPFHGDPADRLLAATALHHSLTLVTADKRLLECELAINRVDASR